MPLPLKLVNLGLLLLCLASWYGAWRLLVWVASP